MNNQVFIFQKPYTHSFSIVLLDKKTYKPLKSSRDYPYDAGSSFSDRLKCRKEKKMSISGSVVDVDEGPPVVLSREILFSSNNYVFFTMRAPHFSEALKPLFVKKILSGYKFVGVCDHLHESVEDIIAHCLLMHYDYGYASSW